MENQQLLSSLFAKNDAKNILTWVKSVKNNVIVSPKNFNWLLTAESAGDKAQHSNSLDWARVALEIYEWPDWKIELGWQPRDYIDAAMLIRQRMIEHFGIKFNDDVLDSNTVQQLFLSYLDVTTEEALMITYSYRQAEKTKIDRRKNRENFSKIAHICPGLRIVERLKAQGAVIWPEVEEWMAVKEELCAV